MYQQEKFWDRLANSDGPDDGNYGQTEAKTFELTKKHLKPTDVVLDFACGTGSSTVESAEIVQRVCAVDISSKMLDVAKKKAQRRGLENIEFVHGNIFDVGYEYETFDVVLAFNVFHLLEQPEPVIRKINELLKPGGVFISASACMGEGNVLLSSFMRLLSKVRVVPHLNNFKVLQLERLIANGRFHIIESEKIADSFSEMFIVAKKIAVLSSL